MLRKLRSLLPDIRPYPRALPLPVAPSGTELVPSSPQQGAPPSRGRGRAPAVLQPPWKNSDVIFESDRLDGQPIIDGRYAHCTFDNVSFLKSALKNTHFTNCIFIDCYFRNAQLTSCVFTGCKFVDCNFGKLYICGGDFRYTRFDGCIIQFRDLQYSMPREPNLRMMLAQELSVQVENLGHQDEARRYHLDFLSARKRHLLAGIRAESKWYREHFPTLERITAILTLF